MDLPPHQTFCIVTGEMRALAVLSLVAKQHRTLKCLQGPQVAPSDVPLQSCDWEFPQSSGQTLFNFVPLTQILIDLNLYATDIILCIFGYYLGRVSNEHKTVNSQADSDYLNLTVPQMLDDYFTFCS